MFHLAWAKFTFISHSQVGQLASVDLLTNERRVDDKPKDWRVIHLRELVINHN